MIHILRFRIGLFAAIIAGLSIGCSSRQANFAATSVATKVEAKPQAAVRSAAVSATEAVIVAATSPPAPTEKSNSGRQERTAFYRADKAPTQMPKVQLSKREQALCKVNVGDAMPAIELPKLDGDAKAKLADLLGKKATVVVFWKGDRRMTLEQLADIAPDVVEQFGKEGVAVVGIAVKESASSASETLTKAEAKFDNLLDADGTAFASVGSERLPRTYVLDSKGNVVWFDIEYSLTTRRELHDVLRLMTEAK